MFIETYPELGRFLGHLWLGAAVFVIAWASYRICKEGLDKHIGRK